MDKLKNLANCTPIEFLRQTNRIRKAVDSWLKAIDLDEIKNRLPQLTNIESKEGRQKAIKEQAWRNFSDILDKAMEEHAEQTLEVLALACFVEPENVNDHSMSEYLQALSELINDEGVLSFFISLSRLGQMNTLSLSKQSDRK